MSFHDLINEYGDPEKIEQIHLLMRKLKEEIDDKILDQSSKRPLDQNEVAFLRLMRKRPRASIVAVEELPQAPIIKTAKLPTIVPASCGLEHQMAMMNLNK